MTRDFKRLDVWKDAYTLCLDVDSITKSFPLNEQFGITQQLRRTVSSIGANTYTAAGSLKETENFLMLSRDPGYLLDLVTEEIPSTTVEGEAFDRKGVQKKSQGLARLTCLERGKVRYLNERDFEGINADVLMLGKKLYSFVETLKDRIEPSSIYPPPSSRE